MRIQFRNIIPWLIDQGPPMRFLKNCYSRKILGNFHKRSHLRHDENPKVMYNTKKSAARACKQMARKNNGREFISYKCLFCEGYHIANKHRPKNRSKAN
jgi:regulator of replication initiation timing